MKVSLNDAAMLLLSGNVVSIPTETVFGLAAVYNNTSAVKKIFSLKNRPLNNPLILHIAKALDVKTFVKDVPPHFEELANAFWPGPLTLVIPVIEEKIPSIVRAGLSTQAFRVPALDVTKELIVKTGPLVAPSANLSGRPSATTVSHVEEDFGKEFPVLEGAPSEKGVESTILIYQEGAWWLGRLGAIAVESFEKVLGYLPLFKRNEASPLCPGQLFRHYAPKATLHLSKQFREGATVLGFSDRNYGGAKRVIYFGSSQNVEEVLARLYDLLRKLDEEGILEAFIDIDVPQNGLWATFHERVKKASLSHKLG